MDLFTAEVITWRGLTKYHVLFAMHLDTRRVMLAGITPQPNEPSMEQSARNLTDPTAALLSASAISHDRDTKFCAVFLSTFRAGGAETLRLSRACQPERSRRTVGTLCVKEECVSTLILFGDHHFVTL